MTIASRSLGGSGLQASVVGLGCNNFGRRIDFDAARAVVDAALEEGVTLFDTADIYGSGQSEQFLGELLQGRRDRVVLATKFGMDMGDSRGPRGSRDYIRHAITQSLRRLRTDVVDVYWYHQPDDVTPIGETLEALDELVRAGAVRAIGASNFTATQIEEADEVARERGLTRFEGVQNEYSLLKRDAEQEVLPVCERLGLGFVPYFPLASGLLTGKYRRGRPMSTAITDARLLALSDLDERQVTAVEHPDHGALARGITRATTSARGAWWRVPAASSVRSAAW